MNYDEFAFFNRQLGAMLKDGIPLEGAIKQLCADMRSGGLREQLESLERDLAKGTPLKDAISSRNFPTYYKKMVEVGVRSNDLPGTLTMLADYYERANALWTRLKGLLVYPAIVIVVSVALTTFLSVAFNHFLSSIYDFMPVPPLFVAAMWLPPVLMALALGLGLCAVLVPSWRGWLRWRVPAFREASLSQLASAIALMLRNGATLPEALAMAEMLETGTVAGDALAAWRGQVESGVSSAARFPLLKPFPPLFVWMLQKSPEQPAIAFGKAAELYRARASYRIELALYGALPVSMLLLGQMIFWQMAPMIQSFVSLMNNLGDGGS